MGDEAPARALPPATVRGKSAPIVVYTLDPDVDLERHPIMVRPGEG